MHKHHSNLYGCKPDNGVPFYRAIDGGWNFCMHFNDGASGDIWILV